MIEEKLIHKEITSIAADYLGPVAPRFVERIIRNHLQIEPAMLRSGDLPELVKWIRLSMAVVTDDVAVIDELTWRLQVIAKQ